MIDKTKKTIGTVIGMIIGFTITFTLTNYFFSSTVEDKLLEISKVLNTTLPMQVDVYTRLDSTNTQSKESIDYFYTLLETELAEVNYDTVNKYLKPQLINNIKTDPELGWFRNKEITMGYHYYDKNGEFVLDIQVTPEIYQKK